MATILPGRGTGASSSSSASGRPSLRIRSGSAAFRIADRPSSPPAISSPIVRGPPGRRSLAGTPRSSSTTATRSARRPSRYEHSRISAHASAWPTIALGSSFSILGDERDVERYDTLLARVNAVGQAGRIDARATSRPQRQDPPRRPDQRCGLDRIPGRVDGAAVRGRFAPRHAAAAHVADPAALDSITARYRKAVGTNPVTRWQHEPPGFGAWVSNATAGSFSVRNYRTSAFAEADRYTEATDDRAHRPPRGTGRLAGRRVAPGRPAARPGGRSVCPAGQGPGAAAVRPARPGRPRTWLRDRAVRPALRRGR